MKLIKLTISLLFMLASTVLLLTAVCVSTTQPAVKCSTCGGVLPVTVIGINTASAGGVARQCTSEQSFICGSTPTLMRISRVFKTLQRYSDEASSVDMKTALPRIRHGPSAQHQDFKLIC